MDVLFIPKLFTNDLSSIIFLILWAFIYMWSLYRLTDGGGYKPELIILAHS